MDTEKWLDNYALWLRKQYRVTHMDDRSDEISTPFVNTINDNIRFYVSELSNNRIKLDDDGETITNLSLMGIDMKSSQRQILLKSILKQFSVDNLDGILSVSGTPLDFPEMKQRLVSAILRVDDINIFKRQDINRLFFEELYKYLDENNFRGLPDYPVLGQTGNNYTFNYVIPADHKNNRPQRLIDFQNNINFDQIAVAAYKYGDIQKIAPQAMSFSVIYNDTEKTPSKKIENVAKDSGIELYEWSNKHRLAELK